MIENFVSSERQRLRLTMREFGEALGVSFALVNMWELGKSKPNFYQLYYVYQHARSDEGWVKDFCDRAMRILRPDSWPEQEKML